MRSVENTLSRNWRKITRSSTMPPDCNAGNQDHLPRSRPLRPNDARARYDASARRDPRTHRCRRSVLRSLLRHASLLRARAKKLLNQLGLALFPGTVRKFQGSGTHPAHGLEHALSEAERRVCFQASAPILTCTSPIRTTCPKPQSPPRPAPTRSRTPPQSNTRTSSAFSSTPKNRGPWASS